MVSLTSVLLSLLSSLFSLLSSLFPDRYEAEVVQRDVPFKYLQLDSFWYYKDSHGGAINWTATPETFPPPRGLSRLSQATGWSYVAHNRYASHVM